MGDLWLKIKVWTKTTLASVAAIYVLIFVFNNLNKKVNFWWWFGRDDETSVLILSIGAFLAGSIVTILVWTTVKTLHQMRMLRDKSRLDRIEREQAELKAKSAMLQTNTIPLSAPPPASTRTESGPFSSNS